MSVEREKENLEFYKKSIIIPFTGTVKKPYDLTRVDSFIPDGIKYDDPSLKRPLDGDIVESMTTIDEYLKTHKSNVIAGKKFDVILFSKTKNNQKEGNGRQELRPYHYMVGYVHKPTGFVYVEASLLNHSLKFNCIREVLEFGIASGAYLINYEVFCWSDRLNLRYCENGIPPSGIIIGNRFLSNADDDVGHPHGATNYILPSQPEFAAYPCISISALRNLLNNRICDGNENKVFANKALKVIDASADQFITPDKKIISAYNRKLAKATSRYNVMKSLNATFSKFGSTLLERWDQSSEIIIQWHRPSNVLIKDKNSHFLFGQDEGTYFGCILQDNVDTIKQAYISLMPPEARGKKGVLRQGEWFAIPVEEWIVPKPTDKNVIMFGDALSSGYFDLPIEHEHSNRHNFVGTMIVTNKGDLYVRDFDIQHDEHLALTPNNSDTWYILRKNTAILSFSQEGVD